jgi:hypothetical protein
MGFGGDAGRAGMICASSGITRRSRRPPGTLARTRKVATPANGQLAVAAYGLDSETGRYTESAIDAFTLEGPRMKEITTFGTPEGFRPSVCLQRSPPSSSGRSCGQHGEVVVVSTACLKRAGARV